MSHFTIIFSDYRFHIVIFLSLVAFVSACDRKSQSTRHPNVIILMTDDQGYGDLACHGNPVIQTPHLDRLYAESLRFTNFHVDPTCSPTRAALMTGRYSRRVGVWHTIMGRNFLREDETTMAELFKASGYKTGQFGKWHLGGHYPYRPIDRGFDYWVGHGDGGTGTANDYWGNDKMNDTYLRNGEWEKFEGFSTDIYFDEAIEFIKRNKAHPFFVYLATNVPHRPWNVRKEWLAPYKEKIDDEDFKRAFFYASISRVDHNLGKLRNFLEKEGLKDNTIFIFLTDNGTSGGTVVNKEQFPTGPGFNNGMRGMKGSVYEGGHRVPFFISWPAGKILHGRDEDYLCAHFDILPTLVEVCKLEKPEELKFDGLSLVPFVWDENNKPVTRTLLVESQRIKYPEKWRKNCMMTDTWRLINGKELYNIKDDPGQRNDVSADNPGVVAELRTRYEKLWEELSVKDSVYERPIIGSKVEPVTQLFGQDWAPLPSDCPYGCPWDQKMHILTSARCRGYWPIEVETGGTYRISLRRWPEELDLGVRASYEGNNDYDVWMPGNDKKPVPVKMGQGKAINIRKAGVRIGELFLEQNVTDADKEITFTTPLIEGNAELFAWFETGEGRDFGAYYVEIELINEDF